MNDGYRLESAIERGDLDAVRKLIVAGVDPNISIGPASHHPLHSAAKSGEAEIAAYLIGAGAMPDLPDDCGDAPIHFATYYCHVEVVKALLDGGAAVDLRDSNGKTPLGILATAKKHPRKQVMLQLLLAAGADPTAEGPSGATPRQLFGYFGIEI